jgi:hypothetical protein
MSFLCQHISRRGFAIIFGRYNGSRAFVNNFGINVYDDLPLSPSLMGYINSFGTEVYFTVLDHFGLRGSAATLISTCYYGYYDCVNYKPSWSSEWLPGSNLGNGI